MTHGKCAMPTPPLFSQAWHAESKMLFQKTLMVAVCCWPMCATHVLVDLSSEKRCFRSIAIDTRPRAFSLRTGKKPPHSPSKRACVAASAAAARNLYLAGKKDQAQPMGIEPGVFGRFASQKAWPKTIPFHQAQTGIRKLGKPANHPKGSQPEPQAPPKKKKTFWSQKSFFPSSVVWVGFPANAHREINLLLPKKFPSTRFSLQNAYKIT